MVKTFEYNGKDTSENFVKLSLKQNVKSLLYFHLINVCAEEIALKID